MLYFFLADGVEETELIGTLDLIKRANILAKTVSITKTKTVTGAHSIQIIADTTIDEIQFDNAEMLILPGGPGTSNLENCEELKTALSDFAINGKLIAAICAAPSILGKLHLLEGKHATCFPGYEQYLYGAIVDDLPAVRDGNMITGRAMGSVFAFAYEIIKAVKSEMVAKNVLKGIYYEK